MTPFSARRSRRALHRCGAPPAMNRTGLNPFSDFDESGQGGGVPALAGALWLLPLTGELTARWSPTTEPATLSGQK